MIRWLQFGIASGFFFHTTAATFTSLGVILPAMIEDRGWGYGEAFFGFSLFALIVGLVSLAPAWALRRLGLKLVYVIGGGALIAGFAWIAMGQSPYDFYGGLVLAGLGYTLCGPVGAIHLINARFAEKRSGLIGFYMTIGGLGGVAGPQMATWVTSLAGAWQAHWWVLIAVTFILTALALLFIDAPRRLPDSAGATQTGTAASSENSEPAQNPASGVGRVFITDFDWAYGDVLKTPQFYVIVAAMTLTLLCGLTMNAAAPSHLLGLGVTQAIVATSLSTHAILNALSRGLGGILSGRIDPKWLLVSALLAEVIGMAALADGSSFAMIALFVLGEGYGFGMCLFATTVLLVNYYGPDRNPELLGTLNLISTIAMIGPVLAGTLAEQTGGFASTFYGLAALMMVITVAALFMRPPQPAQSRRRIASPSEAGHIGVRVEQSDI